VKTRITVRQLTAEEIETAALIAETAYGRSPYRADLELYLELQADGWRIADLDGRPAGIGGVTTYGAYAVIGLMATLPEFRNRGVAGAILTDLLAMAMARNCPLLGLDATEAGARLYSNFGFVEVDGTDIWALPGTTPHRSHRCVEILDSNGLDELVNFDAAYFGAGRRRVLGLLLGRYPGRAFAVRDSAGQMSGYLIAQSRRLGPGAAAGRAEMRTLVTAALSLDFDPGPQVLMPAANVQGAALLDELGFVFQRSASHMRRGRHLELGNRSGLIALASAAIG
jgi:GNAT superfamily N-acetyltransferase